MSDKRQPTETTEFVGGRLEVRRNGVVVTLSFICPTEYQAIEYYDRVCLAARNGRVDLLLDLRPGNVGG